MMMMMMMMMMLMVVVVVITGFILLCTEFLWFLCLVLVKTTSITRLLIRQDLDCEGSRH